MQGFLIYCLAALAEIFGCFAVWQVFKLGRSVLWLVPALASLSFFAWVLTLLPFEQAGRAYAVYGGIYIISSLLWMWIIEGSSPDYWDILGGVICLIGAGIIYLAPRSL
ncbi:YnfA family protein [Aristophania vespae]|uniref:YnfA family protein n=1 Tax=Aristophania vespae TaxID=2697033 RepID=UPI00235175D2|nr:YnfA family protein [Aristophania vespae]UMM63677.1 hypothetical protein DM15PD_06510 [Aristophania vespae]